MKKRGAKRARYADDIASMYIAGDVRTAYEKLKADYRELLDLGESEGSPFNPKKTEVQFFSRRRDELRMVNLPGLALGPPNRSTRWLGVFLDQKLSFTDHVTH